jgi:hypothetical protein
MKNSNVNESEGLRVLGREIGTVLTDEELNIVGGGPFEGSGAATDSHGGTCTNEQDCD